MGEFPVRNREYVTAIADSRRWDGFEFRDGDIVVATAPKCGTTWTQNLCAMLVHGGTELPKPLSKLSRWLDRVTIDIGPVLDEFRSQPWRRVIKTHTPLDGLPYSEKVSYVVCGRDLRDAFLSFLDHVENASEESSRRARERAGIPEGVELPKNPNVLFPLWVSTGMQPWTDDGAPFGLPLSHFYRSFWDYRHLENIHFMHYADLKSDLGRELARLADFLGVDTGAIDLEAIEHHASIESMRKSADHVAPDADLGEWRSNAHFFRSGRIAAWREALTEANQQLYEATLSARLDPRLKSWLETGGPVPRF